MHAVVAVRREVVKLKVENFLTIQAQSRWPTEHGRRRVELRDLDQKQIQALQVGSVIWTRNRFKPCR